MRPSSHQLRKRFHLRGTRRAALLADVFVLLAVEEDEEQPLADRHRLPAARAVEQARLERAERLGRTAARRPSGHAAFVSRSAGPPQRRGRACQPRSPRLDPGARRMPTVYIETYGCQMNVADTELMLGHLAAHGYQRIGAPDDADVILLNTCAIREHAEARVLGRLGELARHKRRRPDVRLGVTGCMAQHLRGTLRERAPWVDVLVGPDGYRRLPELLRGAETDPHVALRLDPSETYADLPVARDEGVRAWVTVMRGCDRF